MVRSAIPWSVLVVAACRPFAAPPAAQVEPPISEAPAPEGLFALESQCGVRCRDPLPDFVTRVTGERAGYTFVDIDQSRCRVRGYSMLPQECSGTCGADTTLQRLTVSFGAPGPSSRVELCRALEYERGEPTEGDCETMDVGGVHWAATPERSAIHLTGHVELRCAGAAHH